MNRVTFAAGAAAILIAGAALAHPHPEGSEGEKKVEKIIIMSDHSKHKGKGHDGAHVRTFHLDRHVHAGALADCIGGHKLVDESQGDEKQKTKVIICSKGGDEKVDAERLEKALARINSNDNLSAEHKERISSALREAIDKARSAR